MSKIKKNIALLGSTGSIGLQTLEIIKHKPDYFSAYILSCNKNYKLLYSLSDINVLVKKN